MPLKRGWVVKWKWLKTFEIFTIYKIKNSKRIDNVVFEEINVKIVLLYMGSYGRKLKSINLPSIFLLKMINSLEAQLQYELWIFLNILKQKNVPASRAHSHRAQLASLACLSAPRARDLIVALRARSCALRIHLSLFLII